MTQPHKYLKTYGLPPYLLKQWSTEGVGVNFYEAQNCSYLKHQQVYNIKSNVTHTSYLEGK